MTPETRNVEWKRWTTRNPAELRVDRSGSTTEKGQRLHQRLHQRRPEDYTKDCPKDVPKH